VLSGEDVVEDAFELVRVLPRPEDAELAERFVQVEPGQTVSRTIDLTGGFRTFREQARWDWRECTVRLRPDAPRNAVHVSYDMLRNCPGESFSKYTGLGADYRSSNMGVVPVPAAARLDF